MSNSNRRRFQPTHDLLDGRLLLSGGVSASLSKGVLSVQGMIPSAPVQVNILPGESGHRHGHARAVVVQGVGAFRASRVRTIRIAAVVGEAIVVAQPPHRGKIPVKVGSIGGVSIPGLSSRTAATLGAATRSSSVMGGMSALEQAVVDLTNQVRLQHGLPPFQVNSQLVTAAQTHSGDMARLNTMAHTLSGVAQPDLQTRAAAVGYNYSWLGENIAFGYPDAPSVLNAWMNSPEHRANILDPNYTQVGVGMAWSNGGVPYATQEFGRPA
jgi:uncharacterized protein YkwD